MRNRSRNSVLVALIVLIAGCAANASYGDSLQKLRPVSVKIVDARSKEPLSGIVVHYLVVRATYRTSTLGVLPPVEPLAEQSIVSKLTAATDGNGEVHFSGVVVPLRTYLIRPREDRVDSEMFFINLEPSDEARKRLSFSDRENDTYELLFRTLPDLKRVTRPNEKYRGYLLETVASIGEAHGREEQNATVDFRPADFSKQDPTTFTIGLRQKDDVGLKR